EKEKLVYAVFKEDEDPEEHDDYFNSEKGLMDDYMFEDDKEYNELQGRGKTNENSELDKIFDLTNFKASETEKEEDDRQIVFEANGNTVTPDDKKTKGLQGTYYKDSNSSNSKTSQYIYTKMYNAYTDTDANTRLMDIYDWTLESQRVLERYMGANDKDFEDGTGNGERDFTFDVTYRLVEDAGNDLYRFNEGLTEDEIAGFELDKETKEALKESGEKDIKISYYTNYTQEKQIVRKQAEKEFFAERNFTDEKIIDDGKKVYRAIISTESPLSTWGSSNTGNKLTVLDPMKLKDIEFETEDLVSHEELSEKKNVLGKNTQFVMKFGSDKSTAGIAGFGTVSSNKVQGVETQKYISEYWVINDFDVYCTKCMDHPNGGDHKAGEAIRIENSGKDVELAGVTQSVYGNYAIGEGKNHTVVLTIARDTPEAIKQWIAYVYRNNSIETANTKLISPFGLIDAGEVLAKNERAQMFNVGGEQNTALYTPTVNDAFHFAAKTLETESTYRIFGFEITDFTDLNFKTIFKDGIKATGNYYSGRFQWDYRIEIGAEGKEDDRKNEFPIKYNLKDDLNIANARVDRTNPGEEDNEDYGGGYVLPVGPNSRGTGYAYAPKLGYTFSFDFKTTGYFANIGKTLPRKVKIVPSFYYLSKDGKTFNENIELYYKNSSGKYVKFIDSGYTIKFKPKDGYRNLRFATESNFSDSLLSSSFETIDISKSSGFILDYKFMTSSFNNFMQTWYGDFKLPNSTIVVQKDGGDVNHPLTNGYIGVRFNISVIDGNGKEEVSYDNNDTGDLKGLNSSTNTSQWDYDGTFNIDSMGTAVSAYEYPLENGNTWIIDDALWQKVKSTVVLYDTDLRADDDFQ
ncbi:MAG: hypothetical protein IJ809_04405, partial [Clostridia bacterium]|nr:hypothetical protein [Clostridia bacterium]